MGRLLRNKIILATMAYLVLLLVFFSPKANSFFRFPEPIQSIYKFKKTPEYMLLNSKSNSFIWGVTASLWSGKIEKVVIGRKVESGKMDLYFYNEDPAVFKNSVEDFIKQQKNGLTFQQRDAEIFDYLINKFQPLMKSNYEYYKLPDQEHSAYSPKSCWRKNANQQDKVSEMSEFYVIWNHDFGSSEEAFISKENAAIKKSADRSSTRQIIKLFGPDYIFPSPCVTLIGIPSKELDIKRYIKPYIKPQDTPQFTDDEIETLKKIKILENTFKEAGNWDVKVECAGDDLFRLKLVSHSEREKFVGDNYWWKAWIEIEFRDFDDQKKSKTINVFLYDSVICFGPLHDNPEKKRSDCFKRTPYEDRQAEWELRERLCSILRAAFGG